MGRSNARGFSLLELVVAMALVILLAWVLFHALAQSLLAGRMQAQWNLDQGNVGRLLDNLTTEEDDAWAIYNPPTDVFGRSNANGHEVDFFARDGKQRPYFWAYDYNSVTETLTRYRLSAPGGIPAQDTTFTGITKFYAHTYPVTALQDASTPIYSALYSGASLRSGTVHFYPSQPWIAGGNNITYVHVEGATFTQDLQLATSTAPSGFTVVVYYTPSPSPTPAMFGTWPANLVTGVNHAAVSSTASQVATASNMGIAFGEWMNRLVGGGVARAATSGVACYAQALNGNGPDFSLPSNASGQHAMFVGGYWIGVSTDGCEIYYDSGSGQWKPVGAPNAAVSDPLSIQYEPQGVSSTSWQMHYFCQSVLSDAWQPSSTSPSSRMGFSENGTGSCNVIFSDGVSQQTPAADAGLVSISAQPLYILSGHVMYTTDGWLRCYSNDYSCKANLASAGDCVWACLMPVPSAGGNPGGPNGCVYYHLDGCGSGGNYQDYVMTVAAGTSTDGGTTISTMSNGVCTAEYTNSSGSYQKTMSGCAPTASWISNYESFLPAAIAPPSGAKWNYITWPKGLSQDNMDANPAGLTLYARDAGGSYIWPDCMPGTASKGMTVYGTTTAC